MKLETPQAVEAASPAPIPGMNPRTRMLLQAPIASTLVKLAWPNLLVMLAQASTGLIETWWVSHLGTDALTGMAVVFPGFMMMQMLSAGAMGGGISSAIARALGARRVDDAEALVLHATVINILLGLIGSAIFLIWGRAIYTAMGVGGGALDAAMQYSNVVFGGSVLVWLMNGFASIIRGTGNMLVPSLSICIGVVILIPLSPLLIFGWGPIPALGIAGGGWAVVLSTFVVGAVLAGYILAGRCIVHFKWARLRWDLSADILRVGAIAAVISLQTSFTVLLTTALVGSFAGGDAVAGFGTGVRLEYLMVPLAFGFGGPLVALVGTNIGAGQQDRALRAALIGGGMVFVITETIGLAAAIWPAAWLGLFGSDPQMIETGSAYLRIVGPAYGFFGLGLSLYFASQGAGKMLYPLLAGVLRLLISIVGGWLALRLTRSLTWLFACLAFALVVYGSIIVTAVATGTWFKPKTS
jgi:putative MATE family efflux protein